MISIALPRPRPGIARAAWLVVALFAAAALRAALNGHTAASAFVIGGAFGTALIAAAVKAGWRPAMPQVSSLLIGMLGGFSLIAAARLAHPLLIGVVGMRPEPFIGWVFVTALVVMGEEVLLRGALFTAIEEGAGPLLAVLVTSLAFGVIHVPLYGWQVVPLDVGVGIFFGGLRLVSGGIAAPTVAHLLADLSTWWL